MARRPLTDDEQDAYGEYLDVVTTFTTPLPGETPRDVLVAAVNAYQQSCQDAIYSLYGQGWPVGADQEAALLAALHTVCDAWITRYDEAVARERRRG